MRGCKAGFLGLVRMEGWDGGSEKEHGESMEDGGGRGEGRSYIARMRTI